MQTAEGVVCKAEMTPKQGQGRDSSKEKECERALQYWGGICDEHVQQRTLFAFLLFFFFTGGNPGGREAPIEAQNQLRKPRRIGPPLQGTGIINSCRARRTGTRAAASAPSSS